MPWSRCAAATGKAALCCVTAMRTSTPDKPSRQAAARRRKSWADKLRPEMQPEVGEHPRGLGMMLLPTPMLVAEEISRVPERSLLTVPELRDRLAQRFEADCTCPLMTGIFLNIIAGRAEEQLAAGETPLAPYWRVVLEGGRLNPKTPAGPERQAELLRSEGHRVEARRGRLVVV